MDNNVRRCIKALKIYEDRKAMTDNTKITVLAEIKITG